MHLRVDGFDWDLGNREKCQKHGVAILEIESILKNNPRIAPDLKHSTEENRLIAVGRTQKGRPVFIAFTVRMKDGRRLIRPVSARYMHGKEIVAYEKEESATAEKR